MATNEAEIITSELLRADSEHRLGLKFKNNGGEIWIRCPHHGGGRERTGSLRVTINENSAHYLKCKCHGCNKYGHYNDVMAEPLGLQKVDKDFKAVGFQKLSFREKQQARKDRREGNIDLRLSTTFDWPVEREWRTIPGKVVVRVGGVLTETFNDLEEPRLAFPVNVWGEPAGYIYALLHDPKRDAEGHKIEIAYLNSTGNWKEKVVFNFDMARKRLKKNPGMPLWIEEGPRDTLHTYAAGCAVVGNMGSSFSDEKAELIKLLDPPRLLVATDADEAGDKLAESIYEHLHGHLPMTRVKFARGKDPCDYPRKWFRKVNEKYSK